MEDSADVTCPYCGEAVTIHLDLGGGGRQSYVEDCPVCCRPWQVEVTLVRGRPRVELAASD